MVLESRRKRECCDKRAFDAVPYRATGFRPLTLHYGDYVRLWPKMLSHPVCFDGEFRRVDRGWGGAWPDHPIS
jgi:hypothetical protein